MRRASLDSGFEVAIGITRTMMRAHGIWPGFSSAKVGLARYSFLPAALMIFLFINLPQTVQTFRLGGDLNAILNVLTLANIPIGIALAKLLGVSFNQDVLRTLVVSLSDDWEKTTDSRELSVMWQKARLSRKLSIICVILGEGTAAVYSLRMFFVLYSSILKSASEEILFRPMYFLGKFPFDTQSSPTYELTWVLQIVATFLSAGVFASVDSLFVALVFHLCGQLINLRAAFEAIGDGERLSEKHFLRKLFGLVERHRRIYEFADVIEYSFNLMFFVQVGSSTVLLCLQGYLAVVVLAGGEGLLIEVIFMLYFTICFTFSIFMYCYVVELLREENAKLNDAIFYSKWYELPHRQARLLVLPLLRLKKPLNVTAGKVFVFSVNLFCQILRNAAGYMSMLLAVREKLA